MRSADRDEGRKDIRDKVIPGQLSLELSGVAMNRGEVVVKQEVMLSGHRRTQGVGETGASAGSDTCTGTNL